MSLLAKLTNDLPFSEREAIELIQTAPSRYKVHTIEKRHGRGTRTIAQPTAEIKMLQRWAISTFVVQLPVHEIAKAYRKRTGIIDHAAPHAKHHYLLKLDFRDFFPSITGKDIGQHFVAHLGLSAFERSLLVRLFCWRPKGGGHLRLSIGAPSSPPLSNTIMYAFDTAVVAICDEFETTYTRYADDLALSTNRPHVLGQVLGRIRKLCEALPYPHLTLHEEKTVFTSTKHQRQLTGLILSNDGKASLGRDKKREIRVLVNRYSKGELSPEETNRLRGILAFARSIDSGLIPSLERMIGRDKLALLVMGAS